LLFCLVLSCLNVSFAEEDKETEIIQTGSGPIKGKVVLKNDKEHYEFLGIPFAQPPVGTLRFKPPEPVAPWKDVLNAFTNGPACMQNNFFVPESDGANKFQASEMAEDCLTLNIFTNKIGISQTKPLAVMVWIHGGGFSIGSKDMYRMQGIVDEDVVLVAMNYRLHALGFLSFGNNLVSGNMGLRDQQLAIQWVKANIQHFGGDPNRITIFGESAGGMSVHAHVLSPSNNGLFAGAIAQSGSILFVSYGYESGKEKNFAENALDALGCPTSMDQWSLNCLQAVSAEEATKNISDPEEVQYDLETPLKFAFLPVVDDYAKNPFLPIDPLEAMKTGMFNRVAYMSGTVAYEGGLEAGTLASAGVRGSAQVEALLTPPKWGYYLNYGEDSIVNQVAARVYNHSTGDTLFEQEKPLIDFYTDVGFLSADQKTVELMNKYSKNVYNYYLTQQTNNSLLGKDFGLSEEYTPLHGDDLIFINSDFLDPELLNEEEKSLSEHMIRYWTTFAKTGAPSHGNDASPVWYPYNKEEKNYMELKSEPVMKKEVQKERMFFWDKMVWEKMERLVEKKQLYIMTTQFLLNGQQE